MLIESFLVISSMAFASGPPGVRDKSPTAKAATKYVASDICAIQFVQYVSDVFTEDCVSAPSVNAPFALKPVTSSLIPTVAHALRIQGKIYNYSYKKKSVNSRSKQNIRQVRPANI